jgi:hypothetical protein
MRSYPAALAWELARRHRWGLGLLLIYLAGLLVFVGVKATSSPSPESAELIGLVAVSAAIPLAATFMMMLAAFSFGYQADLTGRESGYPARMFTMPVGTPALAFWPMLYGTATAAALWLIVARFVFQPCGLMVPLVWPALLAAVFVSWTQVLMWMAYPLPYLRAIAATVLLGLELVLPQFAIQYGVSEGILVSVLAPMIPLAFAAAYFAVGRARHGVVPDWRGLFRGINQSDQRAARSESLFKSAERAQVWFEWRRHGLGLPFVVGILLPFALIFLFIADTQMSDVVLNTLGGVLLLPPFMAGISATTVSKSNPHVRDYYGVPAFTAGRPMTSAALVAAKLKMAVWSTLAAWLLVLVAVPLSITLSGHWPTLINAVRGWLAIESLARVVVITLLVGCGLIVYTWKQLVQNLYIGLTGREWVIKSTVFATLALFVVLCFVGKWVFDHKEYHAELRDFLPWLLGFVVLLKLSAITWVIRRLRRWQLLSDRILIKIGACWLLLVIGLFSVLAWLISAEVVSRTLLVLGVALAVPIARPIAAPLALAWNRHR